MEIANKHSIIKYTAKNYIHDGLIGLWDGIENVGYALHDDNSRVWKDLAGNNSAQIGSHVKFSSNCLIADGKSASFSQNISPKTMEIVFENNTYDYDTTKSIQIFSCNLSRQGTYQFWIVNDYCGFGYNGKSKKIEMNIPISVTGIFDFDDSPTQKTATKTYVNGVEQVFNGSTHYFTTQWIGFGTDVFSKFFGKFYCVRLYNRVLTSSEIAKNNFIDKMRFNLA